MDKRFWEHNNFLGANYTKKRQPVKLVFCQEFYRMDEAYFREKQVQGWSHAKKKALIEKSFQLLPELARSKK